MTGEPAKHASPGRARDLGFYVIAALVGIAVGAAGTAFHLSADALLDARAGLVDGMATPLAALVAAAVSAAMVVAAVALVRRFAPEAAGSGVQEIEGAMAGLRPVRWARILPVKFVGGVLAIGSGLVLGREGPTIHIGASIAWATARLARLDTIEMRGLFAAGAAAGLATAFNAPLAAVLFVIEETRRPFPYTVRTYTGVILAALFATLVTEEIAGVGPDLTIIAPDVSAAALLSFALLGVALGILGIGFNRALIATLDLAARIATRTPYLWPAIVAAAIGAATVLMPAATGGGEKLIPHLIGVSTPASILLALCALRFLATMASYGAGAPGGIFAPILALATVAALAFAPFADAFLPGSPAAPALVVAAMAGLFASTVRAPLVGVVLAAELTGSFGLLLPVIATAAASHLVAEMLGGRPIYEELLERTLRLAGQPVPEAEEEVPVELGWDRPANASAAKSDPPRP